MTLNTKAKTLSTASKWVGVSGIYQPFWKFKTGNSCMAMVAMALGLRKSGSDQTSDLISIHRFRTGPAAKWKQVKGHEGIQAGDLALWGWDGNTDFNDADHIGLVVGSTSTTVTTYEGNTNKIPGVASSPIGDWKKTRGFGDLLGYIRPPYPATATPTKGTTTSTTKPAAPQYPNVSGLGPFDFVTVDGDIYAVSGGGITRHIPASEWALWKAVGYHSHDIDADVFKKFKETS